MCSSYEIANLGGNFNDDSLLLPYNSERAGDTEE
jgi:hypothetical protein